MTVWVIAAGALMLGGLVPVMILAGRGPAAHRLLGLEVAGAVGVIMLMVLCQAMNQSSYLIVPLSGLHQLHSGHIGDYAAWLVFGAAALAGLLIV